MRELLEHLMRGDADAVDLCMAVFEWANYYDHIIDGDLPSRQAEAGALHEAMWLATVTIPSNPFYKTHQTALCASLANGLQSWKVSNELAKDTNTQGSLMVAHVLRWMLIEFFLHCARLSAGREWAEIHAPEFWRAMTRDHSFEAFAAECAAKGA